MSRDTKWDKSGWHQPSFFIGDKDVSETEYRIHLHKEGRSEKEIELLFKMIRKLGFED